MSTSNPTRRELDPVIAARIDRIQQSVFEASGVIEAVRASLHAHHCERIGQTAVIDLVNALSAAQATLGSVGDRLDIANLGDGSRRAVVETEKTELLDDAA